MTLEQCWHRVPGGTAVAAIETARVLAARPDLSVVGVAAAHRSPPPPRWRPPVDTRYLRLPRIALYEAWHYLRRPAVERATGPVDVIHATGIAMPPRTAPIVTTIHDLAFVANPAHFSRAGLRFFRRALSLTLSQADLVLCSSRATLEQCRAAGFDEARLRHVPLGVRAEPATHDEVARVRIAHALESPYVLWVGTVEPRKNLPGLMQAFRQLEHDVDLVLVGPKGWNEDLERLLAELEPRVRDRVRVLGFVSEDDLGALYAGAEVFCFPSLLEGFGFPVLEAMAQGTPVVTSGETSTAELAQDAGILVDPRDPDSIAGALSRVLSESSLAAGLAEAGRSRAAGYTWEKTADLVAQAYAEAAA